MTTDAEPKQSDDSSLYLRNTFEQLLPLVDDLADALGLLILISITIIAWIFVYLFHIQGIAIIWAAGLSFFALIPVLILCRFWYALESLQNIPEIAEELIDDVSEDVSQGWHAAKSGKKSALNIFGQIKKLFEIRTLINSAGEIMQDYFNISPLINPFYLFFSVLSFTSLFFIFVTGLILAFISIF